MAKKKYKILVVEDEAAMNKALSDKFKLEGLQVCNAFDGQEALEVGEKNKPDIIMLDIMMPKLDGMEAMKKIRETSWGKEAEIIMLTNVSDPMSVAEAAKYNVFDFLVKTDWKLGDIADLVKKKVEKLTPKFED